ncbi:MAG: hypothetical protein WC718_01450 [Phycisphaerales bacterium]|jgi:hypothetical protein
MSDRNFLFRSSAGIDHWLVTDGNDSRFESTQPVDDILDRNKAMATENDGYSQSRELRRVASVPYIIALKWLNEEGWWMFDPEHADKLAAKLNSSDWQHLRTADGRLGVSNGVMR